MQHTKLPSLPDNAGAYKLLWSCVKTQYSPNTYMNHARVCACVCTMWALQDTSRILRLCYLQNSLPLLTSFEHVWPGQPSLSLVRVGLMQPGNQTAGATVAGSDLQNCMRAWLHSKQGHLLIKTSRTLSLGLCVYRLIDTLALPIPHNASVYACPILVPRLSREAIMHRMIQSHIKRCPYSKVNTSKCQRRP